MFKVGDRVVLVESGGVWDSRYFGMEGDVIKIHPNEKYVTVRFDLPDNNTCHDDWGHASYLKLVSENTTFSVPADTEIVTLKFSDGSTQDVDVKDRARGVPEWVKDGAWVVNKISRSIARLSAESLGFNADYLSGLSYNFSISDVRERFRPFTNSDWKWGMWTEYKGEKVFVAKIVGGGINASSKETSLFFIPFDKITPATAP